ncbi:MAG TPA: hypothetical protein VF829_01230 [Candidatus Paceibacterota bacterium]
MEPLLDLFGNPIGAREAIHVNVYADEIWETKHGTTGESWIYTAALYERTDKPILDSIISTRYCTERDGWEEYKDKNDTDIHWADLGKNKDKKFIVERWLKLIHDDCFSDRRFYFSLSGINLTNLNFDEFDEKQKLNSIYNRFFRAMLKYSLKKFFGRGVIVENIYHEQGTQQEHPYFDWHTIFKLDQDEHLNFICDQVDFLPKSHRDDTRSNALELCDVLIGIYKDAHCGFPEGLKNEHRREILGSKIVQELLIKRVLRKPRNISSSYGYAKRFHLSFFPKAKTTPESIMRLANSYYDNSHLSLAYENNPHQGTLFKL